MSELDPILLAEFLETYSRLPPRRRNDIAAYAATWPEVKTRPATTLELLRRELESRPLSWLQKLLSRKSVRLTSTQTISLLQNTYRDRLDLGLRPNWTDFAGFGISAKRLELAHDDDALVLGEKLRGGWVIEQRHAAGGLSVVYLARHLETDRRVAVKAPRLVDGHSRDSVAQRLRMEAELLGRLSIPGVPRLLSVQTVRKLPVLVIDWVEGRPMRELRGTIDWREAIRLLSAVAEIVDRLHQADYVHADLKSENILVTARRKPYLIDYNLSRYANPVGQPEGFQGGTFGWMSPETIVGVAADVDLRQDLYGLGMLLYEMVAGKPLIQTASREENLVKSILLGGVYPPEFPKSVPQLVQDLCRTLIERQTLKRYETAADVAYVCRNLLQEKRPQTLPQPPTNSALIAWRLGMAFGRMTVRGRRLEEFLPLIRQGGGDSLITREIQVGLSEAMGVSLAYEEVAIHSLQLGLTFSPWHDDRHFVSLFYRASKLKHSEVQSLNGDCERLREWCRSSLETWQDELRSRAPRALVAFLTSLQTRYVPYSEQAAERWLTCAATSGYPRSIIQSFKRACRRPSVVSDWKPLVDDLDYRVIKMLRWPSGKKEVGG